MSNYKVKVNNEVESEEVQGLFFELGFGWRGVNPRVSIFIPNKLENYFIISYINTMDMQISGVFDNSCTLMSHKELTIPQLRDLVVLKRNSKSDRNIIDPEYDANLYLDSDNKLFVFHLPTQTWKESNLNGEEEVMQRLKPISPTKEYLVPQGNGKYALTKATEKRVSDWVEVPEGADTLTICGTFMAFWKEGAVMFLGSDDDWDCKYGMDASQYKETTRGNGGYIAWQRHTQPEELPFVDDEPNASTHGLSKWFNPEQQKAFAESAKNVGESFAKISKGINIPDEPKSLNSSCAEVEQVRQTLNERESQYGSFKSVANTTGQLMAVILNSKNGQTLPYAHEEALHMICSKIARIMNGDMNHKDSWHDIGGYAKLIEDIIN